MRARPVGAATLCLALFTAACGSGPGASASTADECVDCAIRLEHLATLGGGTGEGALGGQIQFVARDMRGRFLVTSNVEALPYLYDSAGAYLGRLGAEGEGPGEFLAAATAHVSEDSLYVLDRRQGRILVFNADLDYVRAIPGVVAYHGAVALAEGRFAVNHLPYSQPPLRVYTATGALHAEMGEKSRGDPLYLHMHQPRAIAASDDGLWSVKRFFHPVLREWNAEGDLLRELPVDVEWYEPYVEMREIGPDEPPQARITGLHVDESGRIWIIGVAADKRWAEGIGEARRGEGDTRYHPITDPNLVYDTRVSILDPIDGSVLFGRQFDRAMFGLGGPLLLVERRPDEFGFSPLDVYRIVLDPSVESDMPASDAEAATEVLP